jgi:hypothetical protein
MKLKLRIFLFVLVILATAAIWHSASEARLLSLACAFSTAGFLLGMFCYLFKDDIWP